MTFLGDGRIDGYIGVSGLIDGYIGRSCKGYKKNKVVLRS